MGELRLRGKIWQIRYYRNGLRHEESAKTTKKGEAERLLRLREGDIAKGLPVSAAHARYTFDQAADALLTDYQVNGKRSHGDVQRRLTLHLTPWFGGRRLSSITTTDVQAYTARRLEQEATNGTINRELAALKRAFVLALRAGHVLHRPHIPMLAERNVRTGFFEREAFEAVRAKLPAILQDVITFAYYTGWRVPSEILTLEWRQVDRTAKVIRLEPGQTKNGHGREFPYGAVAEVVALIDARWTARDALATAGTLCPLVFHRKGKRISSFRRAWIAACEAVGLPGRIPHDFRRTAVRNLVRAGVSENVAMKITGHLTRSVFDRYDIVSSGDIREAVAKLGQTAAGSKQGHGGASGAATGA